MPYREIPPPRLTSSDGASVADEYGPVLMQDWQPIEKLAHQDRERIPERVVHAKGWDGNGVLRITGDVSHLTCASVLQPCTETPMIARLSTVAGKLGAANHELPVGDRNAPIPAFRLPGAAAAMHLNQADIG